jgi:hypothetical protein
MACLYGARPPGTSFRECSAVPNWNRQGKFFEVMGMREQTSCADPLNVPVINPLISQRLAFESLIRQYEDLKDKLIAAYKKNCLEPLQATWELKRSVAQAKGSHTAEHIALLSREIDEMVCRLLPIPLRFKIRTDYELLIQIKRAEKARLEKELGRLQKDAVKAEAKYQRFLKDADVTQFEKAIEELRNHLCFENINTHQSVKKTILQWEKLCHDCITTLIDLELTLDKRSKKFEVTRPEPSTPTIERSFSFFSISTLGLRFPSSQKPNIPRQRVDFGKYEASTSEFSPV